MALTRGPFIQSTSRRDTNIIWYTSTVEDSVVKVGTSVGNYTMTFKNTANVNTILSVGRDTDNVYKHTIRVTGLNPNTQYFYTIGNSNTVLQGNNQNFFWTMPDKNDNVTTKKIWTIADTGIDGLPIARDAFRWYIGSSTNRIDAWIDVGDMVYDKGFYGDYNNRFFATNSGGAAFEIELKKYNFFSVPGNHDQGTDPANAIPLDSPFFNIFKSPTLTECGGVASFTPQNLSTNRFYSFDIGNAHIITLDAYGTTDIRNTGAGAINFQYEWLLNDLKNIKGEINQGKKKWIIVCCHHPPFNNGDHHFESYGENFRLNVVPLLHEYNVDLVIYGHDHNYQRTQLVHDYNGGGSSGNPGVAWNSTLYSYYPNSDGSGVGGNPIYNKVTYSGTVHIIQGNGGADTYTPNSNTTWNGLIISDFGDTAASAPPYTYGSGVIEITPGGGVGGTDRLTYTMIRANTTTVFSIVDRFHIDK